MACREPAHRPNPIQGMFFCLGLVMDVYSRKTVAHETNVMCARHAAALIERAVRHTRMVGAPLMIHQDHGCPMKG